MKKQFFRVKQLADQTFSRAEKSDVLTEDMVVAEKRVELLRQVCQNTTKKIAACLQGIGLEHAILEKRQKKMPEIQLSQSMLEGSAALGESSAMGSILEEGGKLQGMLGRELFNYEMEVERSVLGPLQAVLDNDIPNIAKLRKQLSKLTLDMDSARARYHTANRHSQVSISGSIGNNKADVIREELEEASMKVEHCRDALASEMFALLSRETELTQYIAQLFKFQATYHRDALQALENAIPAIDEKIDNYKIKPVFGTPLDEHLRVVNGSIASVIEECIVCLYECGMDEEGLFRIAGSASKVKKLKSEFDAGVADMSEFATDPHTVAGALKSYLRELPEPLMTYSLYNDWMKASRNGDTDKRLQDLWQVVHQLPESNFNNLRYLVKFLHQLTLHSEKNKMSSQNIAIVIPPNIIWAPSEDGQNMGLNMTLASTHSSIVDSLVTYADWFFPGDIDFTTTNTVRKKGHGYNVSYPEVEPIKEEDGDTVNDSEATPNIVLEESHSALTSESATTVHERETSTYNSYHLESSATIVNEEVETIQFTSADTHLLNSPPKNTAVESPRVPKRMNKKAAPPIPKDASIKQAKSASLDRSMSSRTAGAGRVLIERAKSYVEKSATKPPLVRKAESASSSQQLIHKTESSSSEEMLVQVSNKSPSATLDRVSTSKSVSSEESFHSADELSSKNTNGDSPVIPSERRSVPDRPTDKPPLPPGRPVSKSGSSATGSTSGDVEESKNGSRTPDFTESIESFSTSEETVMNESHKIVSTVKVVTSSIAENSSGDFSKTDSFFEEVPPERPPRSHSPNIISSEKQFCTVIQLQGQSDQGASVSAANPPVKVKPAKPPLPAYIKPRSNSTAVGLHKNEEHP